MDSTQLTQTQTFIHVLKSEVCGLCHRLHIKPTVRKQKQKPLKTQETQSERNQTTI